MEGKLSARTFQLLFVGVAGFEPATSCSQSRRDNRATLHPENGYCHSIFQIPEIKKTTSSSPVPVGACAALDAVLHPENDYCHSIFQIPEPKKLPLVVARFRAEPVPHSMRYYTPKMVIVIQYFKSQNLKKLLVGVARFRAEPVPHSMRYYTPKMIIVIQYFKSQKSKKLPVAARFRSEPVLIPTKGHSP